MRISVSGSTSATNVAVNSNYVHPPGQPPGISSKTCPGGRDLTFESCLGAGNPTRTVILWKMNVKLQKNSVDQIFTGENKKQAEFLTFFEVYLFSQWNLSWSMGQFLNFGSAITHTLQKISGVAPGLFIFEVFTGLWLSTPTFV